MGRRVVRQRSPTQGGYLNPDGVRMKWEEHLKGASDWQGILWNVLMFQAWLETERNHATAVSRYCGSVCGAPIHRGRGL